MSNVGAKWHARKAADIADEPGKVHFENSWIKITYKGLNPTHFGIKITLDKVVRDRSLKSIKVKLKFPSSAVYRNGPTNVILKG